MAKFQFRGKIYGIQWEDLSIYLVILVYLSFGLSAHIINSEGAPPAFCTSEECLRSAAHLKLSMDPSVEPCDNFYAHACGRWSEQHPNCRGWPAFDGFDLIDQRVADAESEVLKGEPRRGEPRALSKMRDFYRACMDEDSRDNLSIAAMYAHLENANLPIIPSYLSISDVRSDEEWDNVTFDWWKTEALLKQNLAVDVFFTSRVEINIFNSSEYVTMMGTPDTDTPLPSPPKEPEYPDEDTKNLTALVKTRIIRYILRKIYEDNAGENHDADRLQNAAEIILRMEESLVEIITNYSDPNAELENLLPQTLQSLQDRTDDLLYQPRPTFWSTYLDHLFNGTGVAFDPAKDPIYVTREEMEYLSRVAQFLEGSAAVEVELYYWWRAVFAMVINTSPEVVDYVTRQMNKLKDGSEEEDTTKSHTECVSLVSKHMGYAFTYALLDQFYSNETKPKVEIMINNMRKSFMSHVNEITWMDEATKKVTIEKAEEILLYIGYPDWVSEEEELDKHYADVVVEPDAYLANIISTIRSYNMKKLGSLRKKPVREWTSRSFDENEAIAANAFYSPQHNAIEVPMVVLRYPMYRLGLELLNYGAVGAILGHEITHAFDNDGRKFDKFGNQRTWWSNETIENFQNLTECFVDHYENISLEGVNGKINGTLTLGENIADNGGLRAAFNAYRRYEEAYGVEPILPGFENFTTNQVFFIAFASAWCMEMKPPLDLSEENDEHAPHYLRVLGTLQNSEEFSSAFHCPEGSFMNPKKKCSIW